MSGPYSRANGINAFGQVVGFSGPELDSNDSRAFFWSKSTGMFDLGTLGGEYAQALAINDAGFITGTSQTADSTLGATHAFLYQAPSMGDGPTKPMRDSGTLGGSYSYGDSSTRTNHVVGYSELSGSDDRVHAFFIGWQRCWIWVRSVQGCGERPEFALGINTAGQVVGYSYS